MHAIVKMNPLNFYSVSNLHLWNKFYQWSSTQFSIDWKHYAQGFYLNETWLPLSSQKFVVTLLILLMWYPTLAENDLGVAENLGVWDHSLGIVEIVAM